MAYIITIANQKGGVAKTATATTLAADLQRKGYKVLMIDTDPQCNTTDAYRANTGAPTLYDLMTDKCTVEKAVQTTIQGDIIACDQQLVRADNIFQSSGREYILKEAVTPILKKYDFVVIDTLPSLGILLLNALTFATGIIIPISADRDSLQGLVQLSQTINATRKYTNPNLKIYGILITMLFSNTILAKEIINDTLPEIEKMLDTKTFESKIRYTTKVKEAKAERTSLYDYAPMSTAAQDYTSLTSELIKRIEDMKNE